MLKMGYDQGHKDACREQTERIKKEFSKEGDFKRIFGVPSLHYSDANPYQSESLVIIHTSHFKELVARKNLMAHVDQKLIDEEALRIAHQWLIEVDGFTKESIETLDKLF